MRVSSTGPLADEAFTAIFVAFSKICRKKYILIYPNGYPNLIFFCQVNCTLFSLNTLLDGLRWPVDFQCYKFNDLKSSIVHVANGCYKFTCHLRSISCPRELTPINDESAIAHRCEMPRSLKSDCGFRLDSCTYDLIGGNEAVFIPQTAIVGTETIRSLCKVPAKHTWTPPVNCMTSANFTSEKFSYSITPWSVIFFKGYEERCLLTYTDEIVDEPADEWWQSLHAISLKKPFRLAKACSRASAITKCLCASSATPQKLFFEVTDMIENMPPHTDGDLVRLLRRTARARGPITISIEQCHMQLTDSHPIVCLADLIRVELKNFVLSSTMSPLTESCINYCGVMG